MKQMKQILKRMLVFVLALSMVVPMAFVETKAADASTTILDTDFSKYTDGTTWQKAVAGQTFENFTVVSSDKQPTGVSVANGKLKVDPGAIFTLAQNVPGELAIAFDFTPDEKCAYKHIFRSTTSRGDHYGIYLYVDTDHIYARGTNGTLIRIVNNYVADTTYSIKINLSVEKQSYDVYVNGKLAMDGIAFWLYTDAGETVPDFGRPVSFENSGTASYTIDNLKIYYEKVLEPVLTTYMDTDLSEYADGTTWQKNVEGQMFENFTVVHSGSQPTGVSITGGELVVNPGAIFMLSRNVSKQLFTEFDFTPSAKSNYGVVYRATNSVGAHEGARLVADADNIYANGAKNVTVVSNYTADTTYRFKLFIDIPNQNFDVYLDGKLVAEDVGLWIKTEAGTEMPDIGRPFIVQTGGTASFKLDNIKMYSVSGDTIIGYENFNQWPQNATFTKGEAGQTLAGIPLIASGSQPAGVTITDGKMKVDKGAIITLRTEKDYRKYSAEFEVMMPAKKNLGNFLRVTEYAGGHHGIYLACDGNNIYATGKSTQPVIISNYAANTMYKIRLDIDVPNQVYDVYVDDMIIQKGLTFRPTTTVGSTIPDMKRPLNFMNNCAEDFSYYVDNIRIYADKTEDSEQSGDDLNDPDFMAAIPLGDVEGWTDLEGNATVDKNPTADVDQAIVLPEGSNVYRTFNAQTEVVTATADVNIDVDSKLSLYLADAEGNVMSKVCFDQFAVKNITKDGEEETVAFADYTENSWFTAKIVANIADRTYDVYINKDKINKTPLDFYAAYDGEDDGTIARFGFACDNATSYVDNLSISSEGRAIKQKVKKIGFKTSAGVDSKVPVAGGKLDSAVISNVEDGKAAMVIAALYNADGALIDSAATNVSSLNVGLNTVNFADVSVPQNWNKDCSYKVFVWESVNKMKPITDSFQKLDYPTVYIAGDGVAADLETSEFPFYGWGSVLKEMAIEGSTRVVNMAAAGSTSDYIANGNLEKVSKKLQPGDYLFISFAAEDAVKATDEATYKANLKAIAQTAENCGAKCVFVTPPASDAVDVANYVTYMKAVASETNATLIDLNASWNTFVNSAADKKVYYGYVNYNDGYESDYRWDVSAFNKDSVNYDSSKTENASLLTYEGALKAATMVKDLLASSGLDIADGFSYSSSVSYTVSGGVLTVNGSGEMPLYAKFADTPWSKETGITKIVVSEGVETISSNAFSGFGSITRAVVAESVKTIGKNAFPSHNFTMEGYLNTAANHYGDTNSNVDFVLGKLRILSIGNSHTADYSEWRDLIFNDMYNAGLDTKIDYTRIVMGGYSMYAMTSKTADNQWRSHYENATNINSANYRGYENTMTSKTYDLVIIQDYWESAIGRADFVEGMQKTMRWLRHRIPNAEIAWLVDWVDVNSASGRNNMLSYYENNTVASIAKVEALTKDAPDYYIPMGTALQNARSSYLGSTYNAPDCYTNTENGDWAQPSGITNHTVLERDTTHCSYELGRYLAGVSVIGKLFDQYKDVMEYDNGFDYYNCLKTFPVMTGVSEWKGDMTDDLLDVIKESAQNAIKTPNMWTQSQYTVNPVDAIATNLSDLSYPTFTAEGIKATAEDYNKDVKVSNVVLSGDGNSATVTFLCGYTQKIITVSK